MQPTNCNYCPADPVFQLVYLDDAAGMPVCLDHMGHGYVAAEASNTQSFLPVHIERIKTPELVTT